MEADKKSCNFEGDSYEHNETMCDDLDQCFVCDDGKWTSVDFEDEESKEF
jgi:hypothetical protein